MQLNVETITQAFASMPAWEVTAVFFGIAYVLLAAKESLWTWFFAFFGTLIYTLLFWEGALLSSSILNFYYMVMALYGFVLWRGNKESKELTVSSWSLKTNTMVIASGLVLSLGLGFLFDTYTEAKFVYLDAFVMVFSVIATWMLAQKVLENWLYWIVIDSAAIVLYWQSGYVATVVLFTLYVILAFYGYSSWRKALENETR